MAPLGNAEQLHNLAALLMCPLGALSDPASQGSPNQWLTAAGVCEISQEGGRRSVLRQLQALLPPSLMLPQRRLESLVEQALQSQVKGVLPPSDE